MNQEAARTFRKTYPHQNFMSPTLHSLDFTPSGKHIAEISYGEGMNPSHAVVGVTVVDVDGTRHSDLNKCFTGDTANNLLPQAIEYVSTL